MHIDFLLETFRTKSDQQAIIWQDKVYTYEWLAKTTEQWCQRLKDENITAGTSISLEADFSPTACALMLAAIDCGCIVVPLTTSIESQKPEFRSIAEVEVMIQVDDKDDVSFHATEMTLTHPIFMQLKAQQRPGLVLFSSGSTGKSKAAVHDMVPLLEKFRVPRHTLRTLTFLLFDHIGGFNTLFYVLSNAGCVITLQERSPDVVCAAIEKHQVQLLPTSPTFINLLLFSGVYKNYDLSSLQMVTYGTEVMPESTLAKFHELFPAIRLLQTYGLSEIGILRSKSKASDSLWMRVGGEGFATRIVDGLLEVKAQSSMLGYLNAPSPFTADGWFKTGDAVEVDGDYIRILGRKSEIINVGGEKVYPAEVESIIQMMDGVEGVVVNGESNPITGQIVKATVKLSTAESLDEFRKRMRSFCKDKLPKFKMPQKVAFAAQEIHGARFKKMRNIHSG